jgi:3-phenylpropionate/trans-cinnamate dioxygenase ferredoxin subunit
MAEEYRNVAKTSDIAEGDMISVDYDGEPILIANVKGEFLAIGDECTHAGGMLSQGFLEGDYVECPLHAAMFNLRTGIPDGPPAEEATPVYKVAIQGDDVFISEL